MVLSLLEHNHSIVVYDKISEPARELAEKGATPAYTLEELTKKLTPPRVCWLMIPSKHVDSSLAELTPYLKRGDIVIDGGNSYFEDSIRRYAELKKKGLHFLDCGTSGGMEGARHGACMMIGGDKEIFKKVEVLFRDMSVKEGYGYMGKSGAGHFVKMVHNGIEYGMMAAIAEGVQAIKDSPLGIEPETATRVYAHGSIIQSRLVDWLQQAYQEGLVEQVKGEVPKGETEEEMEKLEGLMVGLGSAKMDILRTARLMRVATRAKPSYAGKLLAAMRNKFGGHAVKK